MRQRYPAAKPVILADLVKSIGEPDPHAVEAARAVGGLLAIPGFGSDRPKDATDFNDLHQVAGPETVAACINAARPPESLEAPADVPMEGDCTNEENLPAGDSGTPNSSPELDDDRIAWLAGLSVVEYEHARTDEARRLKVRSSVLDKIVADERQHAQASEGIGFDDVTPWPDPVAGDQLLSDIASVIARFIVCKLETAHAATLWVAMTWLIDTVETAALAVITAPEKRCGKSQRLTVLGKLSRRPMVASNISSAALFRVIDAWQPTLMIDEADAFMRENEELRGILNSGHKRDSAYVVRTVGEDFTPKQFSTWGAKAIAGIGHLADTLMDRAIILDLRRKLPHESVERLRHAEPDLFPSLASKLARWTDDNREAIRIACPDLPAKLHDRAQDNWEPLLAIADVAGGVWPCLVKQAALAISTGGEGDNLTIGAELLADIQEVFEAKRVERVSTADLIETLIADDEKPWATYSRGKPISPRQVTKRLKEYGICSKNIRVGYEVRKGFEKSQFLDVFARYLAPPSKSATPLQSGNHAGCGVADSRNAYVTESQNPLHATKPASATGIHLCSGVADKNACSGYENRSATPESLPRLDCSGVADKKGGTEDGNVWGVTAI
jgi:putative DNA primase/helicase